ncbi:tetratricopeptide repeat protein [Geoalkalibacter sp.]|uniref:tetratricopeptide repeat protein n=1 Tax=Geoalkalibacter sp. TaxID=3041440 RepID=UPI00272EC204|nr:hypothetical protein [Geoalkalibacter sp.]
MVFSRLFGRKNPLDQVRGAVRDSRWADALRIGEGIDPHSLSAPEQDELAHLLSEAGDCLARLNLEEGEACRRAGDEDKGREHLELALAQARDGQLRQNIADALGRKAASPPPLVAAPAAGHCGGGSCGGGAGYASDSGEVDHLDEETRFELTLSSYPPEMAQRYAGVGAAFRKAFLAAHDGRDAEAVELYAQVAEGARDDLFYFERGGLLARTGDFAGARRDLHLALQLNPSHEQALEALITLELAQNAYNEAKKQAERGIETGTAKSFCLGRLAFIHAREGNADQALSSAREALRTGAAELDVLLLAASLHERRGELGEAEALLSATGGGGCKGGASAYLAEFWLRHGRNLEKALDAFNQAARQEPANPRWPLRIGETYLARGWKKEGRALIEQALAHPDLAPELKESGQKLISAL